MSTSDNDFGSGGRVLVAIPLIFYGLFSAVMLFTGPPGLLRTFGVSFGLWMLVVGHLLILTQWLGHYFAIPTYAWLALNSITSMVLGASKFVLIWTAICVAAILYSVVVLWRRRRAHAI